MKSHLLAILILTQSAFALNPTAELDTAFKSAKTIGEFVERTKPHLPDTWYDVLSKRSVEAHAQKFKVDFKKPGSYVIQVGPQMVSLKVLDVEQGRYEINNRKYTLETNQTAEHVWDDVAALMPKSGRTAALDWILPQAHANPLVIGLLALAFGGPALTNAMEESRNCGVYGHEMNDACFVNEATKVAATVTPLAAVAGKRIGLVCASKTRVEDCLRSAVKTGKLNLAAIKDARARSYLQKLVGEAAASSPAAAK